MTAVVVRLEALDRMREELGGGAALRSLVAAADRLATSTREGDELGRWSDDELGLLCPGATPEALRELTSALAATLEQVRVRHELQDGIQITLPLRVELSLVHDLGEEPQSEEDELPPPLRHLHVA
jgi:GGDEF domain-containing protein